MYSRYILLSALLVIGAETYAKNNKTEVVSLSSSYNNSVENNSVDSSSLDSIFKDETLHEVKVVARKSGTSRLAGAVNGIAVNKDELFKAACCNLGESFTTNPSVDVAYNDATTGARQIKLLGLSGTYVQMLTENLPNFRGAAIPYALGYVPGPWMKGIQVSKGSASVKNGYESITGQINVDYLKPEQWSKEGKVISKHLQDICHQYDPSRPVTQGMDKAMAGSIVPSSMSGKSASMKSM